MATDQKTTNLLPETTESSPIENELPTYRAVSSRAVLSVLCGVLSIFSVASPFFYIFAVLAVVLGFTADWNIRRYSDILTGRRIAQTGAALGLIFGLSIFTINSVQGFVRARNAEGFASHYATVMKNGTLADLLWLELPPAGRKTATPKEVYEKYQSAKKKEAAMAEMRISPLKTAKKRVDSSKDSEFHFVKLEGEGVEGVTPVAIALFELHAPATKEFPDEHEYAAVILKGMKEGGRGYEWWAEEFRYPYKPATAVMPEKPIDDGHGHAH